MSSVSGAHRDSRIEGLRGARGLAGCGDGVRVDSVTDVRSDVGSVSGKRMGVLAREAIRKMTRELPRLAATCPELGCLAALGVLGKKPNNAKSVAIPASPSNVSNVDGLIAKVRQFSPN
jgi:hypothetical protein